MASNSHAISLVRASSQNLSASDSASLSLNGDFTLEAWIKITTQPASNVNSAIVTKDDAGSNREWNWFYSDVSGTKRFRSYILGGGVESGIYWDYSLPTNVWHHVALVTTLANAQATKQEMFVNGISIGNGAVESTGNPTSINSTSASVRIGGYGAPSIYTDADMDDVRIWATARTGTQIAENYNTQLVGNETNLQAYWKLNNALTDSTSNGNDLTNNGSATFVTTTPYAEDGDIVFNYSSIRTQDSGGGTTSTWSHKTSGSNRILTVGVAVGTGKTVSGVTYNGVSMTQVATLALGGVTFDNGYVFRLVAPATGANNVVVTASADTFIYASAVSYVGVSQTSPVDVSGTNSVTGTSLGLSLTTTKDRAWLMGFWFHGTTDDDFTAGANTLIREEDVASGIWYCMGDTNSVQTPTGSKTITTSWTLSVITGVVGFAMTPANSGIAYTLALAVGAFTLTGIDTTLRIALNMAMAVGEFVLTGIDTAFSLGKGLLAEVGSFVLTGTDTALRIALNMATTVGEFVLTGLDVVFGRGYSMAMGVGSFILTGMAVRFPIMWRNLVKHVVSVTNVRKTNSV